ncbi:transcobalamin-1 isoform X2 [Canis lupus dingo]|uniref:transcobalamin-1 isoform X2 n=1 Tax=Canis lupus dingo TaxID=286419 RepID=UPI0018F40EEB|nr:transcobalamin-1 isoform X2 [Canis lupus dingo]XP_038286680.1 transcobalamin-1 isoform X2 [Canis lupus familiaris]
MIPSHQLPLVGLLLFSLIPRQQCEICEISRENYTALNPLINTMINSKYSKGIQAANVLLSLRLGGILNQTQEQKLMRQIVRSVENKESSLTSGQLALSILALGACKRPDEMFKNYSDLVKQLENKFQEEIKNMEHDDNPLTNYYQLSLDVLALCLFSGNYSISIVATKFNPENKNYYFHGQFSVDTGAMAVLALTCVMRDKTNSQNIMYKQDLEIIGGHIGSLIRKILSQKKEDGLIGNIYSTGEAMQALFVSSHYYKKSQWDCQKTRNKVLEEIPKGVFRMPTAAAQILPALLGKTYLDVNKDSPCVYKSGAFNLSTQEPTSGPPAVSHPQIQVNYSVVINTTYNIVVSVANGSVFLDVMEKAQKENATLFSFTAEESSWGPYITTVQGIKANSNERTYWALLSNGKPLSQGAGSYVVHAGENLEVRWSKY